MKKSLAIVGTGISGMALAYFLKDDYEICVFEKEDYIGGHTNTITHEGVSFDTGFMVFNEVTYPLLIKLFKKLGVPYYNTDMSFAVRVDQKNIEYNGSSLSGLFSQRKNLLNPLFIRFLLHIDKFNKKAPLLLKSGDLDHLTVKEMINHLGLGKDFLHHFLIPMSAAVWSMPFEDMMNFSAKTLVQFFYNHGFMGLDTQHQWKTVEGGSQTYREKLIAPFRESILTVHEVTSVERVRTQNNSDQVRIAYTDQCGEKQERMFDQCILACHSDQAYKMLKNPTDLEKELLPLFKYQKNIATVHSDEKVMPKLKKVWSSWNYILPKDGEPYTVYYMNMLQKLNTSKNIFININGEKFIEKSKIIKQMIYHHPLFTQQAQARQKDLEKLNDDHLIFYAGAYFRYGFHEDGLLSAVKLASKLLKKEVL